MATKAKAGATKVEHVSRAPYKKTSIGNSVRTKARPGRKKSRGQGR